MEPLVSIIVPIYNVEPYLKKCIDSIINQTLTNIEIILVNDGSTDNCGKIIDEYAKKDNRIIALHKENGGQASARNMGLDIASGKYIGFVDSDDCIYEDMFENLYKFIKKYNSDICVCGREAYSEDDELSYKIKLENELIDLEKYDIRDYVSKKLFYKHTVVVWNKIYKNETIQKNNIRFEDVSYVGSEDALFNFQYLMHTQRIQSIEKIGYRQLSRVGSTATTYKHGYMNRTANMIKYMHEYSITIDKEKVYNYLSPVFLLFFYQWNMSNIKSVKDKDIEKLILNEIIEATNNDVFMKCVKKLGANINLNKYMKNMGFKLNGIILIRVIMNLYSFRLYKLATKLIVLR